MKATNTPLPIPVPFASAADPTTIALIPIPSQQGITPGAASYEDGFPRPTFLDTGAGGVAPRGVDFNGILNAITQSIAWAQSGGQFIYNATFQGKIGGHPMGAILQRSDMSGGWISTIDQNTNDPDTGGTGWLPYGGSTTPLTITVSGTDVTLTALQAASNVLVLSGTLSANMSVFLPAWNGVQWLVVNETSTSIYTLTVSTAAGSGVVIADATQQVIGDGVNINPASDPGISDAPADGNIYGRKNNDWVVAVAGSPLTNPMTSAGDLIYGTISGNPLRLPIGTNGWVLTVSNGLPVWTASSAGFTNPMTSAGDLILGGTAGAAGRLGIGAANTVLTSNGTTAGWGTPAGFANPMNAIGQIIYGGTSGAATALAAGSAGLFLKSNGTGAPVWATPPGIQLNNSAPFTKAQGVTPTTGTVSGTVTPDASTSNNFEYVISGNLTIANPTNLVNGYVYNFCIDQNGTGGFTIALGSLFKWTGGTAPTWATTAGALNFFSAYYDGAVLRCGGGAGFA